MMVRKSAWRSSVHGGLVSMAKVDLVTENFKEYKCDDIIARRAINSKNPGSTTTEVLIYN